MRVYVETNFLLELAYRQSQVSACEKILEFGLDGRIDLRVPAFAITEAALDLVQRERKREGLVKSIEAEIDVLRQSSIEAVIRSLEEVRIGLVSSMEDETRRLNEIRSQIKRCVISLDADILDRGLALLRDLRDVGDATVLASVLLDLERSPVPFALFLNKDSDFAKSDIRWQLTGKQCSLIPSFEHGWQRIRSKLGISEP